MDRLLIKRKILDKVIADTIDSKLVDINQLEIKQAFKDSEEIINNLFLNYVPSIDSLDNFKDMSVFFKVIGKFLMNHGEMIETASNNPQRRQ